MIGQYAQKQYSNTQISTADRLRLVVMLYEGAISFLRQAMTKMERKDIAGKGILIGKAQDIISELDHALNFSGGGEIATNLHKLYGFINRSLIKINMKWDPKSIERVIQILSRLKDAWNEICVRPSAEFSSSRPAVGGAYIERQVL